MSRKLHIYAPWEEPFGDDNWAEQILGDIVLPLYREFEQKIDWLFVGRYIRESELLGSRFRNAQELGRFIALRVEATDVVQERLEKRCLELVGSLETGCGCIGWEDMDLLGEYPPQRYCRSGIEGIDNEEYQRRINLIFRFHDATTSLLLDALRIDDQGRWRLETNGDIGNNPQGSFFQSVLHLFCNATDVPLRVILLQHLENPHILAAISNYTYGYDPKEWRQLTELPIQF